MTNPSFSQNSPRYLSTEQRVKYSRKETEWKIDRIGNFACLLHYRDMRIYTDLEKIQDYEISNTYAYELALRTVSFKDEFLKYLAKDKREKDSRSLTSYSDEFKERFLLDPRECMNFENGFKFIETRKDSLVKRSHEQDTFIRPKFSRPQLCTPNSENMSKISVTLSLALSEQELVALIKAYKNGYEDFKQKRPLIFGDNEKLIVEYFGSKSKLIRTQKKFLKRYLGIVKKIKKPNTRKLNMAEQLFTHDMISIGYDKENIAESLMYYRGKILYEMNKDLFLEAEIDIGEISEYITTEIDESTLSDNFDATKKIIDNGMYRSFFVIKSSPFNNI